MLLWVLFLVSHCYKVFPLQLVKIRTLPGPVSAPGMVLLFPMVLSLAVGTFLIWMHWSILSWRLKSNPLKTPVALSFHLSPFYLTLTSLVFCSANVSCLGFLEFSTLFPQPGRPLSSISVCPTCTVAWEHSLDCKLRQWWGLPFGFFSQGLLFYSAYCSVSESYCSIYVVWLCSCLRQINLCIIIMTGRVIYSI